MIAALLAFLLEPAATSTGPTFSDTAIVLTDGALVEVAIVGGSATPARVECAGQVLAYAAPTLSDGDTVGFLAGPVPLTGPFATRCTLRSATGFDGLWVVYAGP